MSAPSWVGGWRRTPIVYTTPVPPQEALDALLAPSTRVTRRIDIYEEDAVTPFALDVDVVDGQVAVDGSRDERRSLDVMLSNLDGSLNTGIDGLWYDKIIKPYRGIVWDATVESRLRLGTGVLGAPEPLDWDGDPLDWDGEPLTWGFTSGAPDSYLRTADAPAHNLVSGDLLTIVSCLSMDTWKPLSSQTIVAKWNTVGNQRAFKLQILPTGQVRFTISTNGTNELDFTSALALPFNSGVEGCFKVDALFNNGAGGIRVGFSWSIDGVNFNDWGSVTSTTLGANPYFDSDTSLRIGATAQGDYLLGILKSIKITNNDRTMVDLDFTNLDQETYSVTDTHTQTAFQIVGTTWAVLGGFLQEHYWETQIGEFLVDVLSDDNFPNMVSVTGRDYTKKLIDDKFGVTTSFPVSSRPETIIRTLATNSGITKMVIPYTGAVISEVVTFDSEMTRWEACKKLATDCGHELFFSPKGYLVMRKFKDPIESPIMYRFQTGESGNLAKFTKKVSDNRIYNRVVLKKEISNAAPLIVIVENHDPSSPTSIENLGRTKTYTYTSAFFPDEASMLETATTLLKTMALESYDVSFDAIVIPWLEATEIVEFLEPDANADDPTRYLFSSFNIPLKLGVMSAVARRVRIVT